MNRFADFLRETLRKTLMRILILTEKSSAQKTSVREDESVLKRDIHIPPAVVAVLGSFFLYGLLLLEVGNSWPMALSLAIFVLVVLGLFTFYLKHDFPKLIADDEAMMLLGTIIILFAAMIGALKRWPVSFYLTPLPAASILAALLLHPRLSLVVTMVLSIINAMVHQFAFDCFMLSFFAGCTGAAAAVYVRSHKDFIRTAVLIAISQFLATSILALFHQNAPSDFGWQSLWALCNGFASAMLALGLLPFLESFFLRLSPMRLLELADFNQPMLKRLMVEAPGTYHHSLMMATIAEAAAAAIGGNPLLARVGAYYHDIGKLVKPEYFIENQGSLGSNNPHGNLAPALSSLVVISHVKEGVALARAAKLPQEIINFIPMHHGTSRIEYFYHQAREDAQEELIKHDLDADPHEAEVGEQNFRYPGPRPYTKETAILMLADSVEAAARTLEEPNHMRLKELVHKLMQSKIDDGQLSDAPLTLADLSKIEEAFTKTLTSIYHARIEYPESRN